VITTYFDMTSLSRVDYGTATMRWPVVVEMSVSSALLLMLHFGPGRRADHFVLFVEMSCLMALINGGSI
jgi:hypothetical protein